MPMRRIVTIIIALAMVLSTAIPMTVSALDGQGPVFQNMDSRGPVNDTDSEPNNEVSKATNVTGNVSITGDITFNDPADFFRVHLNNTTSPNRLNTSLEFTSGDPSAIAYLAILDPFEFRLDQILSRGNQVNASAVALYADFYYIGVLWDIQNQGDKTVSYTLNVSLVDHVFTPDGDDHPDDALPVDDGAHVSGSVDELEDVADFLVITMDQGADHVDVVLLMLTMDPTVDIAIEIYNSGLSFIRQVNSADSGGDEMAYFVAPAPDDYYFRIWANTGTGAYDLQVMAGTGWQDGDNDPGNATLVQEGVALSGNLSDDYDPEDFYKIGLALGEEITVNLTSQDYNTSMSMPVLNIWLYNETNFVKNSTSSDSDTKEIWYEAEAAGWYYIRIGASDMSFGGYDMLVTVVSPPVILPHNSTVSIGEDEVGVLDLSTIFLDPQGENLEFNVTGNDTTSIIINATNATISSLVQDWYGSEVVTFSAENDLGKVSVADITVVFTPANDAPTVQGEVLEIETNEDEPYHLLTSVLSTKFTDVDGDDLSYSFVAHPDVTINMTNDTIDLVPAKDWNGQAILLFVAEDPAGLNATLEVNLTVHPVDDVPVGQDIGDINLTEDGSTTVDLSTYFMDPDGDTLVFDGYSEGDTNGERHVFVAINGSNATITLTNDWYGEEPMSFTAKDAASNAASISARMRVSPVNDAPVVSQTYLDIYSTETWVDEDRTGSFDMTKLFIDVDGDNLVFQVTSSGAHITAVISGTNLVVTPPANWYGVESVNVSAEDPTGMKVWADLPITVLNANDGPTMSDGAASPDSGNEDTKFKFSVVVTDIDGDEPIVSLIINGKEHRMAKESGDVRTGAQYTYTAKLKGGKNKFSFKADDNQHSASSVTTAAGGDIDIEEPMDSSAYLFYAGLIIVIIILVGLIYAAYNRAQRMKEFDDSWDDDEEEEDEEITDEEE